RPRCELDLRPPLRPAACFWARLPPLPLPRLRLLWLVPPPLPLRFPPRLELPGEFEIAAARPLLIPRLRRPSYCLSFLTLLPWSLAMTATSFVSEVWSSSASHVAPDARWP